MLRVRDDTGRTAYLLEDIDTCTETNRLEGHEGIRGVIARDTLDRVTGADALAELRDFATSDGVESERDFFHLGGAVIDVPERATCAGVRDDIEQRCDGGPLANCIDSNDTATRNTAIACCTYGYDYCDEVRPVGEMGPALKVRALSMPTSLDTGDAIAAYLAVSGDGDLFAAEALAEVHWLAQRWFGDECDGDLTIALT